MVQSTDASQPGERVGMLIGPDDIHIMKKMGDVHEIKSFLLSLSCMDGYFHHRTSGNDRLFCFY